MGGQAHRQVIGHTERFAFDVCWLSEPESVRGLGWGALVLWVGGRKRWASESGQGIEWTWVDLVEHLARAWGHLLHEESAPYGLVARSPSSLRSRKLLRSVPGVAACDVESAVHRYQHRHDLAAGLKGIDLPPVWLTRSGRLFRVEGDVQIWCSLAEVLDTLESFVNAIKRATKGPNPAPRTVAAFKRWKNRAPESQHALSIRTALTVEQLQAHTPEGLALDEHWGDPANEIETPFMAAARLTQPLGSDARSVVLKAIGEVPHKKTPELDKLGQAALAILPGLASQKPHEQGYALALWLREVLDVGDAPVDPLMLLKSWCVHLGELPPVDKRLDACACWGVSRGPAVLVNPHGQHAISAGGRRATYAHEVMHLLVDRFRELPAAEVFGGATPLHLEKRAKAFAAEFLLPRHIAAGEVASARSLSVAASALRERYGISMEVLGWQIRNGSAWSLLSRREKNIVLGWTRTPTN